MDTEEQNNNSSKKSVAKWIPTALFVLGALCILASFVAFGDIGLSFGAIGLVSIVSGIGFLKIK